MRLDYDNKLAFLQNTKVASSSLDHAMDKAQHRFAKISGSPELKHLNYKKFQRLAPLFDFGDFTTVCVIRHPLGLLNSWFRYRARPQMKDNPKYTGNMSLEEFAETINPNILDDRGFITGRHGRCVDMVFRYEALGDFETWLQSLYGSKFVLGQHNVSPKRTDTEEAQLDQFRPKFQEVIRWYETLQVDPATGAVKAPAVAPTAAKTPPQKKIQAL